MVEKDPHLVPDHLIFFIAAKAARYMWADVRNYYTIALQQIKYQGRGWADDLSEITENHLPPSSFIPYKQSSTHQGGSGPQGQRFGTVSKAPCHDWNDKSCTRPICKFDHRCQRCNSYDHPASSCISLLLVRNQAPPQA